MFKLEKLKIEDGQYSSVKAGHQVEGKNLLTFLFSEDVEPKKITSLSEIELGRQVMLYRNGFSFIQTSHIKEILEQSPRKVKFRTQTSIYLLTEED